MTAHRTWLYLAAALVLALAVSGCVSNQPAPAAVATVSAVSKSLPAPQGLSVTLAWNPVINSNLAGYNLYTGRASGLYTNLISVGNLTNSTVSNLQFGVWYFFAVTALAKSGLESGYSQECFCVALPTNVDVYYPTMRVFTISPFGLTFTNPPSDRFFKSTMTGTNGSQFTWRLQSSGQIGGWTNTPLTVTTSSRSQTLAMLNPTNWISGTNYSTNVTGVASISKPPNINPFSQ